MKLTPLRPALADYSLYPRVSEKGKDVIYRLCGNGIESALENNTDYIIRIIPQEEIATAKTLRIGDDGCYDEINCHTDDRGIIEFSCKLDREQIYTFRFLSSDGSRITDCKVFCAEKDLWERTPVRGNTHCHVCFSTDGHEDPVIAASLYRKAGYDFLAITDHHKIDGSVYAVEHCRNIPTEMALFYGEEVHVPNAYLHIVNIGARMDDGNGLDVYYHSHEDEVNSQVEKIVSEIRGSLPEGVEPYDYAWRKWTADMIHEKGGAAIIAHPFWEYDANNTSNAMLKYLGEQKLFDGMEVVHGQDEPDCTDANRQIAFWNDLRAEGVFIPVVGADDAHRRNYPWDYGSDFCKAYTIMFVRDNDINGFKEALCGGYSSAVSHRAGMVGDVAGTYRMTVYSIFLLENYYPAHDDLCFEEGRAMNGAYLGNSEDMEILNIINGRVKKYTDLFFGRN